jgi:hypothetical protein
MTPVLTFRVAADGRQVALLGAVRVGEVRPWADRAAFWVCLPDIDLRGRPSPSIAQARARVVDLLNEWLLRAGIFYPGQEVQVAIAAGDESGDAPRTPLDGASQGRARA